MNIRMNRSLYLALALGLFSVVLAPTTTEARRESRPSYPATERQDLVEEHHGTQVADPYRWLEDDQAPNVISWTKAQNQVTRNYLDPIKQRAGIRKRLEELWNYDAYGLPKKSGDFYYYFKKTGLQNQSVLFRTPQLGEAEELVLDPNKFAEDGTSALGEISYSKDGRYLAYSISKKGSDWREIYVKDLKTGEKLTDHIEWAKFTDITWDPQAEGFYYSRYPQPTEENPDGELKFQKLYYHRLGTPQSEDRLVFEDLNNPHFFVSIANSDDDRYLILTVGRSTEDINLVSILDTKGEKPKTFVPLIDTWKAGYSYLGNDGSRFYFQTNDRAPKGRIIQIDLNEPAPESWKELIAEGSETILSSSIYGNRFIVQYLKDATSLIKAFDLTGDFLKAIPLPGIGTVGQVGGKRESSELFFSFTSFTQPSSTYRFDLLAEDAKPTIVQKPQLAFNPEDFETTQVWYPSKDGTKVPMFITHKKGLKLNSKNPTLLYGYGGFNISITPSFSPALIAWMEMGGVYAVPNLRGGGEFGEDWHRAGMLGNKQNVFDDFIAAGEWLIQNKYTERERLANNGRSNGGLLAAATAVQRPDLFAASIPEVGVLDMLRYQKFTVGHAWMGEYGDPARKEDFHWLHAYSPLHNVKKGISYPATLVMTADHDDRVVPAHSFKFAAALQYAHAGCTPALIRIQTAAGHGAGTPTSVLIDAAADRWAFLVKSLGMK